MAEVEYRQKERDRALAQRHQAGEDFLRSRSRARPGIRDTYYRLLARIGRRTCAQGFALGCALEARALDYARLALE